MLKRKKKSLLDQAGEALEGLLPAVEQAVGSAVEVAKESLADTREFAAEKLADGRELASEKLAAVQGETTPKRSRGRGVRRLLLVGLLVGLGGVLFKKLRDQNAPAPRPAPVPAPRPTPRPTPAPPTAHVTPVPDDQAGASPDESLADDASGPHQVTTPDEPAELVEVEPAEEPDGTDSDRI